MKVLFTCTDRPNMARNLFYREFLQKHFEYDECVSFGKTYKTRIPHVLLLLLVKVWKKDFFFVSYMGHFLVPLIRIFSKKPIIFDCYLSLYDMMCFDRKLFKPDSMPGRLCYWLDKTSLSKADHIIVDTDSLIDSLSKLYNIQRDKFLLFPLAVNEKKIFKHEVEPYTDKFLVMYMGSYIPLHGVKTIIESARILQEQDKDVLFLMLGKGQLYDETVQLVDKYSLTNIKFIDYVSMDELNYFYNAADLTLGIFGTTPKAKIVIPNKTYEAFAVGKAHLTLKTAAMEENFSDSENIFFVDSPDPKLIAHKILSIKHDPETKARVEKNMSDLYENIFSNQKIEAKLKSNMINWLSKEVI